MAPLRTALLTRNAIGGEQVYTSSHLHRRFLVRISGVPELHSDSRSSWLALQIARDTFRMLAHEMDRCSMHRERLQKAKSRDQQPRSLDRL